MNSKVSEGTFAYPKPVTMPQKPKDVFPVEIYSHKGAKGVLNDCMASDFKA